MKALIYLFLFLSIFLPTQGVAQSISGTVSDAETGEPIAFATVYLSGTMIGTTTDVDGSFSLAYKQAGNYTLVISFVGYKDFLLEIADSSSNEPLRILLQPEVIELDEVYVNSDPKQWEQNFPTFKRLFLGQTVNAAKVEIENPKDIYLFFDEVERTLYAHAKKEIIIRNEALGYLLTYNLKEFQMDYRSKRLLSFGIPRFDPLASTKKKVPKRWQRERKRAYKGSFVHFLRSLKRNTFLKEGYLVYELHKVPNRKRPPQDQIDEKLAGIRSSFSFENVSFNTDPTYRVDTLSELEKNSLPTVMKEKLDSLKKAGLSHKFVTITKESSVQSDSLSYWARASQMPITIDSLGLQITSREQLMTNNKLNYIGFLKIVYTKEPEEVGYSKSRPGGGVDKKQTSTVQILAPLEIHENGWYEAKKVFFEGYMGWSAKIAEMLPLEYQLPQKD